MLRDGQIITDRRGRFALVKKMNLIKGQVVSHRDGYGFLIPDDNGEDLFLSPRQMRTLFPGDRVLASVILEKESGKREGAVVEVLSRNFTHIIGRYEVHRGVGFVIPTHRNLNPEIVIPDSKKHKAKKGDIVLVEIMSYPTGRYSTTAKIVEILGKEVTPSLEIDIVANAYGLSSDWSKQIIKESKEFTKLKIADNRRVDLRELPFVTIDGKNAKDFDDAVYCEKHGDEWILYVAIADVSHYVGVGSFIDQEAFKRGSSIYFPNQVIPMLPEVLSNDLCSLKPLKDRPTMVCEIKIDRTGRAMSYKFYEALIRSQARLIYDEVYDLLEKKPSPKHRLLPQLLDLRSLYRVLLRQRKARGTLDFSRREVEMVFNDDGTISKIIEAASHYVHGMIEEFMLLANVCASKFLLQHKIPALYRVHESPDQEKLIKLRTFLKNMGLELGGGKKPKAIHYARLMEKIVGRKEEYFIQLVILRSLKQASYAYINVGHFGLAYEEYTHFTSPIRRYPDLVNHRAIKYLLSKKAIAKYHYKQEDMQNLASHCSFAERRADDALVAMWSYGIDVNLCEIK
jgi:ribonuclease R